MSSPQSSDLPQFKRRCPRLGPVSGIFLLLAGAAIAAAVVALSLSKPTPKPAPTEWVVDMTEDFDSISSSRWNIKDNWYATNESSYMLAQNVSTRDGVLRVQGKPESVGGRNYTSGRLDTNGKYALPNYFRAEVRAKVPFEQGMWSAPLWFRPARGAAGEIDLVETYGGESDRPEVHQTIHSAYGSGHEFRASAHPYSDFTDTPGSAWHTYTIEKTPGNIKMWVDGHLTSHFTADSAPWFNQYYEAGLTWELRVCLQIGGSYGLPDSTTDWSHTTMELDYIKTWVPS